MLTHHWLAALCINNRSSQPEPVSLPTHTLSFCASGLNMAVAIHSRQTAAANVSRNSVQPPCSNDVVNELTQNAPVWWLCTDQSYSAFTQMTNQRLGQVIIKHDATFVTFWKEQSNYWTRGTLCWSTVHRVRGRRTYSSGPHTLNTLNTPTRTP